MSEGIKAGDVCRQTGVTYRQLDYWVRRGWITPSVYVGNGSGRHRVFSADQVERVATMGALAAMWSGRLDDVLRAVALGANGLKITARNGLVVRITVEAQQEQQAA